MIGFPIGLFVANGFEWYAHKVWLHEKALVNRKGPLFTHIHHHKAVRLNGFRDDDAYHSTMLANQDLFNEKISLVLLSLSVSPLLPVAPFFTLGIWYGAWNYYGKHSKAHLNPEHAKKALPWHYDHHMNTTPHANYTVTRPWFDYIMGTRIIGDASIAETNPLGMKLPPILEKQVNRVARRLFPKVFAQLDHNAKQEKLDRQQGIDLQLGAA